MRTSFPLSTRRSPRELGLLASAVALAAVVGCRDEPLDIPSSPGFFDEAGQAGEGSGGGQGGEGGTLPYGYGAQAAASYGAWAGVELPPVPIAGTTSQGGSGGSGGGGSGGGPIVNKSCGDSKTDPGEECDDGNKVSGDGCSSNCLSSCETCEKNECINWFDDPFADDYYTICYNMPGKAEQGSAVGVDRKQLCRDLIDCVRGTKCAQETPPGALNFRSCWCNVDWSTGSSESKLCNDPQTFVPGACAKEFEEASEAATASELLGRLTALNLAIGPAFRLLRDCDQVMCREECVGEYFDTTPVATITADISSTADPTTGESALGSLIADAYRAAGATELALVWSPTYFFNAYSSPGLLFEATPSRPADGVGEILPGELRAVFDGYRPQDNPNPNRPLALETLTLTGQQIYDVLSANTNPRLQISGMSYTWDSTQQVTEVRRDGSPIDKAQGYTVTVDTVLGARGALVQITPRAALPDSLGLTVLTNYIKSQPQPIEPPAPGRIVKTP